MALTFPNNAVTDLLSVYEKLTGMTLVKDTSIFDGAPISLITPKPVEKAEAIRLIEATLLTNGYSITLDPSGKSARIREKLTAIADREVLPPEEEAPKA